jgi:hypothetical protein
MTLCIRLENPFTAFLVVSTVFTIPTWLRYTLVALFFFSNASMDTKKPTSPNLPHRSEYGNSSRSPSADSADSAKSVITEFGHSLTELTRHWLATLYLARSRQSDDDLPRLRAQRHSIGHRPVTKASVHWRGSRNSLPKTPKDAKDYTWTQLDEDGHAIDIPHRQNTPRTPHHHHDPPCCQPTYERSNNDCQLFLTAINQQTDVLNNILSSNMTVTMG